jgi:hypothetical protein
MKVYYYQDKKFCGIQATAEWLFKSHLPDRKQEVKVKSPNSNFNTYSYWGTVKYAFLWGSENAFSHAHQWLTPNHQPSNQTYSIFWY